MITPSHVLHFREYRQIGWRIRALSQEILSGSDDRAMRRDEERDGDDLTDTARHEFINCLLHRSLRRHPEGDLYGRGLIHYCREFVDLGVPSLSAAVRQQQDANRGRA